MHFPLPLTISPARYEPFVVYAICSDNSRRLFVIFVSVLRTIIFTDADGAVTVETVSPETSKLNLAFGHVSVLNEKPGTEDTLGKDIQDSIGNDLAIDTDFTRSICQTPDTVTRSAWT